MISDDD